MREYEVRAFWDPEASVWVAESEDVPGLVTEAETVEQLIAKLQVMVPDLLEVNGVLIAVEKDVSIKLVAERAIPCSARCGLTGGLRAEAQEATQEGRLLGRPSRQGRSEIWYIPSADRRFPVDSKIKSRHTANGVLKQAGLKKAF